MIPEDAIIKYMTHPTVMMVHSDLLRPNFRQDIANGVKYTDSNIYLMSRHLAMFLLIRNAKRPVVISSLRCKDMDDAIIKRSMEERKPGVKRDQPVYLCVAGEYAQTGFKTVVVSSMSVEVDRWQMLLNFYLVRQTFHGASGTDTLFCSLRRESITNFGQQVVKVAWVDDCGLSAPEEKLTCTLMRHTAATWSGLNLDREGQALVAKMLEHSLRTADSAYRHTERRDAERYLSLTRNMLKKMPESIPNEDRVDAVLELDSEKMRQAAESGEVVLRDVNRFVLNDDLVLLTTDESEGEDGTEEKRKGKQTSKGHIGKMSTRAAAAKKSCATEATCGAAATEATCGEPAVESPRTGWKPIEISKFGEQRSHTWTEDQKKNFLKVFKGAIQESFERGLMTVK